MLEKGGGKDGGKAKKGSSKAANFNKVGEGREGGQFPKRPHHEAEKDNKDKVIDKGKGNANPGGVNRGVCKDSRQEDRLCKEVRVKRDLCRH